MFSFIYCKTQDHEIYYFIVLNMILKLIRNVRLVGALL